MCFRQSDPQELTEIYKFGDLQAVPLDYADYTNGHQDIHAIKEDRYNPGTLFLMIGAAIMKYTPGQALTHFLGDINQTEYFVYEEGNSSVAKFSIIFDLVQYNRTKIALADYVNNCVREYDYETDIVQPLFGECGKLNNYHGSWKDGDNIPGNSNFLALVLSIQYVESENYFIVCDQGFGQLSVFDVATSRAMPLLDGIQSSKVPTPLSLLLSKDEKQVFVSHVYGISLIDLTTRQVTSIVGQASLSGDFSTNLPLVVGPFKTATVGLLHHLSWLVNDQVLIANSGDNQALVVINLVEQTVLASCKGESLTFVLLNLGRTRRFSSS